MVVVLLITISSVWFSFTVFVGCIYCRKESFFISFISINVVIVIIVRRR